VCLFVCFKKKNKKKFVHLPSILEAEPSVSRDQDSLYLRRKTRRNLDAGARPRVKRRREMRRERRRERRRRSLRRLCEGEAVARSLTHEFHSFYLMMRYI
jgi:hypothetical protein